MAGKRREIPTANSGDKKPKTPPSHNGDRPSHHGGGNKVASTHHCAGNKVEYSHHAAERKIVPSQHGGGRKVQSPINNDTNRNFNSGNKLKTAAHHHERVPGAKTPVHGKKTQRAMQEVIEGFERTRPQVPNSKLPRAIHKPSTLATIERRHSYTSGEAAHAKLRASENVEYSTNEIEKMVKDEISNMQEKINSLRENLSKCSHGIEMIQREQSGIFHRYEVFLGRCTPDMRGKKHKKESVHFPPLSQKTSLISNGAKPGGHEEADKSSMISNIKKIARKRSNELALRETEPGDEADESRDKTIVKQTTSSEETRKSARLNKARDVVRRAAAQHFRKREKSASQPSEIQDILKQETIHKSDSKIAQILRAHDKMAKVEKVSNSQKK